jgi:threonine/homoserine/homoserine lactone efflux protein
LIGQARWLGIIGGLFLLYLGGKTFFTGPADHSAQASRTGLFGTYLSTFFLTITNPMTILSFIAIFAGLRMGNTGGTFTSASLMVLGVFIGSAAWWLTLSGLVSLVREKFTPAWMGWVNRIAGIVIFTFGLFALLSV